MDDLITFCTSITDTEFIHYIAKSIGSPPFNVRGFEMLQFEKPVKLRFINLYTYHNLKPILTVMHIQ